MDHAGRMVEEGADIIDIGGDPPGLEPARSLSKKRSN